MHTLCVNGHAHTHTHMHSHTHTHTHSNKHTYTHMHMQERERERERAREDSSHIMTTRNAMIPQIMKATSAVDVGRLGMIPFKKSLSLWITSASKNDSSHWKRDYETFTHVKLESPVYLCIVRAYERCESTCTMMYDLYSTLRLLQQQHNDRH